MSEDANAGKIFINGKQQAAEVLRELSSKERGNILCGIKGRNPTIYRELMELCFDFSQLNEWSDESLKMLLDLVRPTLIGIALKDEEVSFQRRCLSLLPREKAQEAYSILQKNLGLSRSDLERAKNNLGQYAMSLVQAGRVTL